MEILNFTATSKAFEYENDNFRFIGSASYTQEKLTNVNAEVYSKDENQMSVGHINLRFEGEEPRFDFNNVLYSYASSVITTTDDLLAKIRTELNLDVENSEPLAEE